MKNPSNYFIYGFSALGIILALTLPYPYAMLSILCPLVGGLLFIIRLSIISQVREEFIINEIDDLGLRFESLPSLNEMLSDGRFWTMEQWRTHLSKGKP